MKKFIILLVFLIIGTLLTQGFQCASPEMTTAKIAIQNRDWAKAEMYLNKELDKNPQNTDAWLELFKTKQNLGKTGEAAVALSNAEKTNPTDPKFKDQISLFGYQLWIKCYNEGLSYNSKYYNLKDKKYLDSAIYFFNIGSTIRPEILMFYSAKGKAFEEADDTINAVQEYQKYKNAIIKDLPFLKSKKIHKYMLRTDAIASFGNPVESKGIKLDKDSVIIDYFKIDGQPVYLSFISKDKADFILDGWKINPPSIWMEGEKYTYLPMDLSSLGSLAQIAFNKKDYKTAMDNTLLIKEIDPGNIDANNFLIQIYDIQGKRDEALTTVQKLVETEPGNKYYIAQYGEMLFKMDKFDEAIEQFEKALKIDPNYFTVDRNIAACYKNKAVLAQHLQQDQKDKDPKFKLNPNEYFPMLKKSADYFEASRQSKDYKMDFITLKELANLYDVLENNTKLLQIAGDLEKIENDVPDNLKENYWYAMVKIYSNLKLNDKLKKAMEEAEKFKK